MDKPFHVIIPTLTFDVFYNKFFKGIKAFEPLKEYLSFISNPENNGLTLLNKSI